MSGLTDIYETIKRKLAELSERWYFKMIFGVLIPIVLFMLIYIKIGQTLETYETDISRKYDELMVWINAHPKYGLLIAMALLVFLLVGLILRWKWACHWTFNGKLWFFDDCKPETKRSILIVLASVALLGCITLFFNWR